MITVQPVPVEYVAQVWPDVEPFLVSALEDVDGTPEWSGCYNIHHIQGFIAAGQWLLIVVVDGANKIVGATTVSFINYPMQRVAFVTLIGGRRIARADAAQQLFALLKSRGATKLQGMGSPAIVRLWKQFGCEPRATLFEAKL